MFITSSFDVLVILLHNYISTLILNYQHSYTTNGVSLVWPIKWHLGGANLPVDTVEANSVDTFKRELEENWPAYLL